MEANIIAATLRRLRGQASRPPSVTRAEEAYVFERGLAKFHEWPSGHYQITQAGAAFLAEGDLP